MEQQNGPVWGTFGGHHRTMIQVIPKARALDPRKTRDLSQKMLKISLSRRFWDSLLLKTKGLEFFRQWLGHWDTDNYLSWRDP
jgi:hypothetical protein